MSKSNAAVPSAPSLLRHGLKITRVLVASLAPHPANVNRHPDRNLRAIRESMNHFGQVEPLVVQKGSNLVIGGNGRLEVLRADGVPEVDVVEIEISDEKAKALCVALNRTAELAERDEDALSSLLKTFSPEDMLAAGYEAKELETLMQELGEITVTQDEVPAMPDAATTVRGDIWVMGNHRLMCGDSASPQDLDRLLAGKQIHLVNTDPPYNVKVEPRSNNAIVAGLSSFQLPAKADQHDQQCADLKRYPEKSRATHKKLRAKDRPLMNDFMTDEAFDVCLEGWFGNIARALAPGGTFYIWGGYANCANYPPVLKRHGLYFAQAVIWIKEHPVLTRKDFMGNHEWCFYGWKEGAGHNFYGPSNVTDTWHVKKVNPQSMVHLTEKPVELAARAMQYSSKQGENVLDLFGGSGSTMMAAEQQGRNAFSMELDPLYCDVIVQRWEKFTGKKAERQPGPGAAAVAATLVPAAPKVTKTPRAPAESPKPRRGKTPAAAADAKA